jgi:glycosyltransferase involved in cell wall biosynthesis
MTDGSLFWSPAKKNILIIQSPVHLPSKSFAGRAKLYRWKILCYSDFVKKIIMDRLDKKADVLPPFVDDVFFQGKGLKKENMILTVGRFFPHPHSKKQDFLIKTFKKNHQRNFPGWKLVVAGGLTERGGDAIAAELKKEARGCPIDIIINPSFAKLTDLYQKAKIYWHAAGVSEDLDKHPERAEHFGLTTLEAMAGGTVPVVFNAGGQKEIVADDKNGYLWNTEKELNEKTARLIKDTCLLDKLSKKARESARNYSSREFYERLQQTVFN